MNRTLALMAVYEENSYNPTTFFASMFRVTPASFFNTEAVSLDVVRNDNSVAITVQDVSAGYRMNVESIFKNGEFTPPPFKEAFTVNAFELLKRQPGQNPFQNPDLRMTLIEKVYRGANGIARKIRNAGELQASQVLLTGKADFKDENGNILYTLDYGADASHFPTAGTAWNLPGADIIGDLDALANVIRSTGGVVPNQLVFGSAAWGAAMGNEAFMARFNIRNANFGAINMPEQIGNGGTYHGQITVGMYTYQVWTNDTVYEDPETKEMVPYMSPSKVLMKSTTSRLDAAFGAVPNLGELLGNSTREQFLPELPARLSSTTEAYDLFFNAWMDERRENLFAGCGSRPIYIPTALDSFGALDTGL